MKTSKVYGRKSLIASLSLGGLLFSNTASAAIINWTPATVAVPLRRS